MPKVGKSVVYCGISSPENVEGAKVSKNAQIFDMPVHGPSLAFYSINASCSEQQNVHSGGLQLM
jgi:hypothetical protein